MSARVDAFLTVLMLVFVAVVVFGSLVFSDDAGAPSAPVQVPGRELPAPVW